MVLSETELQGAFVVELQPIEDERGFFARSRCENEFSERGLEFHPVQCNISYNRAKGTLRGLHYQVPPFPETKLVRCTKGAICDVIVDIRPESRTFKNWLRIELSEENHRSLFVPTGFAHGFQTLRNNCEIYYEMSAFHHPECARGIRWNDPSFGIVWPMEKMIISLRDQEYADFEI